MKRTVLKRVFLPVGADTDEKIRIIEGHINELENTLESVLDFMNSRISGEVK